MFNVTFPESHGRFVRAAIAAMMFSLLTPSAVAAAAATAGSAPERYPLEQYLTGIAREQWAARAATLAGITTAAQVEARIRFIRAEFLKAIGGLPATRAPLNARITGTLVRQGYRVEKVIYESLPGCHVTANLYVPTTGPGPFPAVLGAAGHAMPEGKAYPVYQSAFIALARRGYVVLAYDPPGQGERFEFRDPATGAVRSIGHISPGLQVLLTGGTSARYFLWDGIRGLDYLLTRPEVDPARIAAAGNSGGGTQSAFLAVCEPRLVAAAPSCYWTSWEALWRTGGPQDSEQVLPNSIRNGLDFSDLAIAFAPKPLIMLTATKDSFPVEGARVMHAEARRFFALLGAEKQIGYFEYNDGHGWSKPRREATTAWFDQWLYGRTEFVAEPAIVPEPVAALRCTDTGQVITAFGSKTMQRLNADLAEELYPRRTLGQGGETAASRRVIAERLAMPLTRQPPATRSDGRQRGDGFSLDAVTLEPEPGIALATRVVTAGESHERRPAVILCRDDATPIDAAVDRDVAAWRKSGHVVILARLRGVPEMPEKKPYYSLYYKTAMRALLIGKTMAGMRVQDLLAVYDYTRSRPDVAAGDITVVGTGNMGVVALYAAALEPGIARVIAQGSLISYLDVVRGATCPEVLCDLIVPGALLDFDLPDIARMAGAERVVLVNPVSATGQPVGEPAAHAAYGFTTRVFVGNVTVGPALYE